MKFLLPAYLFFFISCSYQIKIKTGDQAYQSKQYAIAQSLYRNEFDETDDPKEKAYKAFKIGQCYKYVSNYEQSLKWFKNAYDLNYGLKALEEYAHALKNNGEYEAAISAFQELSSEMKNAAEFRKEITICKLNLQWKEQRSDFYYKLDNLSGANEKGSDYAAVIDPTGKVYFVSDRLQDNKRNGSKFAWTGRFYSDLFVYDANGVNSFSDVINSQDNEGPFCFNSQMNTIYFTRCSNTGGPEDFCNIYYSIFANNRWSDPELIDFGLELSNQIHPAIYHSDSVMVFSSDAKKGIGQYDLYISYLGLEGWSFAENLGDKINTSADEKFPVWYNDTLLFSSNGHPGMGGLDVFKSFKSNNAEWAPPINFKPSINSEADDFGFFVDTGFVKNDSVFLKGVISSNRTQSDNDEIYSVELRRRIELPVKKKPVKFKWEVVVNIQFVSHEVYKNNKRVLLDSVDLIEKISRNSLNTKTQNKITLKLLPGDHYTFLASKKNYLNKEFQFDTPAEPELTQDSTHVLNIEVEMLPLNYDDEFILQEMYYDFDDWKIRKDAVPALSQLKSLLITNPTIKVMLGSHTDCRGDEAYNDVLSAKRAQSAVEWLVNEGISPQRLLSKGYGEHDFSVNCKCQECTEAEHQLNRRTTFRIVRN